MKTITFNGHTIELYDSIQDLNIVRHQLYNLNLMLDAGIGSNVGDFDARSGTIKNLIRVDPEKAIKEVTNLQMTVRFIMSQTNPKMNSFVALIHSIDGKRFYSSELTESRIKEVIQSLGQKGLKFSLMERTLNLIKKKSTVNSNFSFLRFLPVQLLRNRSRR